MLIITEKHVCFSFSDKFLVKKNDENRYQQMKGLILFLSPLIL